MKQIFKLALSTATAVCLTAGQAHALGALVGPDGTISITASRALLVREADAVQLAIQIEYEGTPAEALWLVALPNFNDPAAAGVVSSRFDAAAFDALEAASAPTFTGACDGTPNGETAEYRGPRFGVAPNDGLPTRFFTARDIDDGDLQTYAESLGLSLDAAAVAAIDDMVEKNFMFAAIRVSTAALDVNKIAPVVKLRWPREAGAESRVAYRPLGASAQSTAPVTIYTLAAGRMKTSNLNTAELDFEDVRFEGPGATDYTAAIDRAAAPQQSRMLLTEFAGPYAGAEHPDLTAALAAGGPFLTRLQARLTPPALRATPGVFSFAEQGAAPYDRAHVIEGSDCGEAVADAGIPPADMGLAADMGAVQIDAGLEADGSTAGGGGGGGGCAVSTRSGASGTRGPLALFGFVTVLGLALRRRRR